MRARRPRPSGVEGPGRPVAPAPTVVGLHGAPSVHPWRWEQGIGAGVRRGKLPSRVTRRRVGRPSSSRAVDPAAGCRRGPSTRARRASAGQTVRRLVRARERLPFLVWRDLTLADGRDQGAHRGLGDHARPGGESPRGGRRFPSGSNPNPTGRENVFLNGRGCGRSARASAAPAARAGRAGRKAARPADRRGRGGRRWGGWRG